MFFFRPVKPDEWSWEWSRFVAVHSGTVPAEPRLDMVDADYYANCLLLLTTLAGRGYRRIGVATELGIEQCLNYTLCAAGDLFARLHPDCPVIEPCLVTETSAATASIVQKWIKRHRARSLRHPGMSPAHFVAGCLAPRRNLPLIATFCFVSSALRLLNPPACLGEGMVGATGFEPVTPTMSR